jgi:hypothetical protein
VRRRPWYQLSHKPGAINNRARAKHSSASSSFLKISLNSHCYKKKTILVALLDNFFVVMTGIQNYVGRHWKLISSDGRFMACA